MGVVTTITCDQCRKDITLTDAMPRYRLRLTQEQMGTDSPISYSMAAIPLLPGSPLIFCGIEHLTQWLLGNVARHSYQPVPEDKRHIDGGGQPLGADEECAICGKDARNQIHTTAPCNQPDWSSP